MTTPPIHVPDDWRWASVRDDLAQGRLWKARDRLQGHLAEQPADQDVLDLLGAVHFAMGDLPQAGRYWWLTEREDDAAVSARAAFHERFGMTAAAVLRALPRPARPERYPPPVRARLEDLVVNAGSTGSRWRWAPTRTSDGAPHPEAGAREARLERVTAPLLFFAVIALLVVGAVTVAAWVIGFVGGLLGPTTGG